MEENNYGYDPSENYEYEDKQENPARKSILGYRVVIILLALILAGISVLYFNLNRQQQHDYELLTIERDSIQSNLSQLIDEYDNLQYSNDTIAANLEKANEVMEQLKRERRWNYAKIKEYEREVGTLRTIMKSYLRQIDSLNTLNKRLADENVKYKKVVAEVTQRAEIAEERATESENRIAQGAVLRARDIAVAPLNAKGREVSRVKNASTLRVDFTVAGNELASTGNREIYTRIISPDGYLLSTSSMPTFDYNGESTGYSASREVDYQNEDIGVSIYYNGSGFAAGTYKVELYASGNLIGSREIALK